MGNNSIRLACLFLLALCLTGCPGGGEEDCYTRDREANVEGLVLLQPLKSSYTAGETVTLQLAIPSVNAYFDNEQTDIFQKTGNAQAELKMVMLADKTLFDGNAITFTKGAAKPNALNTFLLSYDATSRQYELEMTIKLNRTGDYEIPSGNAIDLVEFKGPNTCDAYFIHTNISGGVGERIAFTVNP